MSVSIPPLAMPVIERLRSETRLMVDGAFSLGDAIARSGRTDAAFVYLLSEAPEPNKYADTHSAPRLSQRVSVTLAVVSVVALAAAVRDATLDASEVRRSEVLQTLLNWQIPGTERPLEYGGFSLASLQQGLLFQEQRFVTRYRLLAD
jgi:hypothetical protein